MIKEIVNKHFVTRRASQLERIQFTTSASMFRWTMAGRLPRMPGSRIWANKVISDGVTCSTR